MFYRKFGKNDTEKIEKMRKNLRNRSYIKDVKNMGKRREDPSSPGD